MADAIGTTPSSASSSQHAPGAGTTSPAQGGMVDGIPRRWLRFEGLTLVAGAMIAYSRIDQAWWLIPLTLLLPDLTMIGYLGGPRLGSRLYNVGHSTLLPAGIIVLGWWQDRSIIVALGLVWAAHVGLDRMLGYGLKYGDSFQHTHLGRIGRNR